MTDVNPFYRRPMTDIDFRALPILDRDRAQYHAAVRSFQAHRISDIQRRKRIWFWLALIAGSILIGSVAGNLAMLPLKTVVPLFLVVREDGTVDTSVSLADLGPDMAEKIIRASLWRYVEERESYSFSEAKHRYDLVSLMSAENVQHDYQQWFLKSADSPQKLIGQKGQISVQEISISLVRDRVFLVRFWKIIQIYGEKPTKTSATATVEFELLNNAPASLVLQDPVALRIVRYQTEDNSP